MEVTRNAILKLLTNELPIQLMNSFEERLYSHTQEHHSYVNRMFPDPEFHPAITGQLINTSVHQTLRLSALEAGVPSIVEVTSPRGSEYAKVTSNSFIFTGIRADSSQFSNARYRQRLAHLNSVFDPPQLSLLEDHNAFANSAEKLFAIFSAFIDNDRNIHLSCLIPNEGLSRILINYTFDEIRAAAITPAYTDDLELPIEVKRQLRDLDNDADAAQG